jgi:hypothetical protein
MRIRLSAEKIEYISDRYIGAGHAELCVRIGPRIRPEVQGRFLTARFRLYTILAGPPGLRTGGA